MKRSEINRIIYKEIDFLQKMHFQLPPFAFWSPVDWSSKGHEYDEIRDNMLGWDITDFGSDAYMEIGLLMFTIRNGNYKLDKYLKTYAEKLLIVEEEQITPLHFHYKKMEDIVNRCGGNLLVQVFNSSPNCEKLQTPVLISCDGRNSEVAVGTIIRLKPGESITLPAGQYHTFWGEKGKGRVVLGEVSNVNDDTIDNHFYEPVGRFPEIDEDEAPLYLLGNEYPQAK